MDENYLEPIYNALKNSVYNIEIDKTKLATLLRQVYNKGFEEGYKKALIIEKTTEDEP